MTFGEIQTLCSYWIDDLQFGYFTLPQVKFFINNAQREAQKELINVGELFYCVPVTTALVANQTDYVLPTDFVRLHRADIIASGSFPNETIYEISPLTLNQQTGALNQSGPPQAYYLRLDRIVLSPAPDTSYSMRMWYSPRVQDMILDTDTPNVPIDYHEFLAIKAAYDCLLKDNRDVSVLLKKLEEFKALMKQNASDRQVQKPRMVVMTDDQDSWGGVF